MKTPTFLPFTSEENYQMFFTQQEITTVLTETQDVAMKLPLVPLYLENRYSNKVVIGLSIIPMNKKEIGLYKVIYTSHGVMSTYFVNPNYLKPPTSILTNVDLVSDEVWKIFTGENTSFNKVISQEEFTEIIQKNTIDIFLNPL